MVEGVVEGVVEGGGSGGGWRVEGVVEREKWSEEGENRKMERVMVGRVSIGRISDMVSDTKLKE